MTAFATTFVDVTMTLPSLDISDAEHLAILLNGRWVTATVMTRSGNRMTVIKRPLPHSREAYRVTVVFDSGAAPVTGEYLDINDSGCLLVVAGSSRQYRSTPVMRCSVTEN